MADNFITLTDRAVNHVKSVIERSNDPDQYLRLACVSGGCSGLNYKLGLDKITTSEDRVSEFSGLKVVVDSRSSLFLRGMTLDYSEDLNNTGFVFMNPNAASSCGCGSSFTPNG